MTRGILISLFPVLPIYPGADSSRLMQQRGLLERIEYINAAINNVTYVASDEHQ